MLTSAEKVAKAMHAQARALSHFIVHNRTEMAALAVTQVFVRRGVCTSSSTQGPPAYTDSNAIIVPLTNDKQNAFPPTQTPTKMKGEK